MNKIYRSLDAVHASDELKSVTLSKCLAVKSKKTYIPQIAAACLAVLTLSGGAGVFHMSTAEAAYISIDINPSIGLSLNRFMRVIDVDTYNEEAEKIVNSLELDGLKYTDAIDDIMESEALFGYDVSSSDIYIEGSSDSLNQEINDTIQMQCPNANLSCHNAENKEIAMEYNISPGKYYLIEQIIAYGGTIDDYKDMSMRELKEIYAEYSGENYSHAAQHDQQCSGQQGSGQQNGSMQGSGQQNGSMQGSGQQNGSMQGSGQQNSSMHHHSSHN